MTEDEVKAWKAKKVKTHRRTFGDGKPGFSLDLSRRFEELRRFLKAEEDGKPQLGRK
jgi:hypothetical protein